MRHKIFVGTQNERETTRLRIESMRAKRADLRLEEVVRGEAALADAVMV